MKQKELPKGWEWKRLGDVGQYINGKAFKPSDWTISGKPIVRIQNLTSEESNYNFFQGDCEEKYLIENGDILISWSASLGVFVWTGDDAVLNQHIFKAIPNEKLIDRKFFVYVVGSIIEGMKKYSHGSTMKHIVKGDFDNSKIPLPPLPVQRQIVAVLEQAAALKRQRQEADALTGALLQSMFYEMFGDPVRNEWGWKETTLGEVCSEIYRYPTFYGFGYSESGVPVIRITNILYSGGMDSELGNYVFIEKEISEKFPRTIIEYNDIVMAVRGDGSTVKRIGIVNTTNLIGANMSPNLIRIKVNPDLLNPSYLFGLMTSDSGQKLLEKNVSRTAKKTITGENIKKIKIPLPPLALQQQFAHIVEEVERVRGKQAESGKEIEALCDGLMQRAFAGELAG